MIVQRRKSAEMEEYLQDQKSAYELIRLKFGEVFSLIM